MPLVNFTYYADESRFWENWDIARQTYGSISWQTGHCEACVIPPEMPTDAQYKFDSTCNIQCISPWIVTNEAPFYCILCDRDICAAGEYMACDACMARDESPCETCLNCTLQSERRDDNWEYTSHGTLNNERSCDFECKTGYFESGLDCIRHSTRPPTVLSPRTNTGL